jgi:hemoglobin/transferrin/lactoferrin receptor protein
MRSVRGLPLAAAVLMFTIPSVEAQEPQQSSPSGEVVLDEVVVTPPKAEKPAGGGTAGQTAARRKQIKQAVPLESVVVTTSKVEETAIDTLAGASSIGKVQLDQQFQPQKISEFLRTIPGVTTQETPRDTATAINIRGLQDFGRVNVLLEGARQNFQRSGHTANGVVYIEPEMLSGVEITRGPTATVYGSGAIGGVAAFDLLTADDILKAGEYAAVRSRTGFASNGEGKLASGTVAARSGNFDIVGQVNGRWNNDYEDGSGHKIAGSNDKVTSEMVKARWRPALGHQVTASIVDYNSDFIDQVEEDGTLYDTGVRNNQYTLGYTFTSPTNPLIDFSSKIYYNETNLDQTRLTGGDASFFTTDPTFNGVPGIACPFPTVGSCFMYPGVYPVGSQRSFDVETEGFDVFNTSRFGTRDLKIALTYGGDAFRDNVFTVDPVSSGDEFTPSGERQIWGGFVQSDITFLDIFELIAAVRYDNYKLDGGATKLEDERVSPKVTLGVTPIEGLTVYGTYAEGFRAPALSETLISGFHPGFAHFLIQPNPDLLPEVAHNLEAGVNLKYNNVLQPGDAFRAKFSAFRNKVDNYIDQVFIEGPIAGIPVLPNSFIPVFIDDHLQYQNIANATIEGVEFEAYYDAGAWFAGLGAHRIRGENDATGIGLYSIPADQISLTAGFRALDNKLVAGARTRFVGAQDRFIADPDLAAHHHAEAYTTVDLFAQYEVTEITTVNVNIDNLFDETYRQHLDQYNSPGLNARVGLTMRLGAQ